MPPERPFKTIPQRGPDEGYDWSRPDVMPAVPESPEPARLAALATHDPARIGS